MARFMSIGPESKLVFWPAGIETTLSGTLALLDLKAILVTLFFELLPIKYLNRRIFIG